MPATHRPLRLTAIAALAWVAFSLPFVPRADAGQYYVSACDAAIGGASHAWHAQAGSFNTYKLCPSAGGGSPNGRGMVTRLTGRSFGSGEFSRLWFWAPGGTSIARIDWSGRMARDSCLWQIELRADGGFGVHPLLRWAGGPGQSGCTLAREFPSPIQLATPAGTTAIMQNTQCAAGTCPSGATFHTYYAGVLLNDHSPPGLSITGGVGEGEWVRSERTVSFSAADNIGIKSVALYIDGAYRDSMAYGCDYALAQPCTNHSGFFSIPTTAYGPGTHRIELVAVDASDTPVSVARTIRVDNTPPAAVTPTVAGGEGWRRAPNRFDVSWRPLPDSGSPIVGATWELCRPGRTGCTTRQVNTPNPTALPPFELPADGAYELRVALRDQAGNVGSLVDARVAGLRLDRVSPDVTIDPIDPNNPIQAAATVRDPLSGLGGGQIEMRRAGTTTWREIATSVNGDKLVGLIDDERFADGNYELRVRAVDRAGNANSTGVEANGAQAHRQLPIRIKTRLRAGRRVVKTIKRRVGRGKNRRVVKRKVTSFRPSLRVHSRRTATVSGILTNPDGQPLEDVPVQVFSRPDLPGAGFAAAAVVRTDRTGRFTYKVRGTTSRTLRLRYDGTTRIRPSTADVKIAVPARSTFRLTPRRIVNGQTVTFSGRVQGGPIPAKGKLIQLQKRSGRTWLPFRVVRTDAAGRWRHVEPVVSVSGLVVFRLRAQIPAEGGFPYATGNTPARTLRVRGL
jgi:5-hydroxyisourate hydrolase-like protein (transthyretin family)